MIGKWYAGITILHSYIMWLKDVLIVKCGITNHSANKGDKMSILPAGVEVNYTPVKVKIVRGDSWYKDLVGQTLDVQQRTWLKDGQVDRIDYQIKKVPGGGYDAIIRNTEDIEVVA